MGYMKVNTFINTKLEEEGILAAFRWQAGEEELLCIKQFIHLKNVN